MTPKMYLLMRNDVDSLNPGKACAQAMHAGNDFEEYANKLLNFPNKRDNPYFKEAYYTWKDERTFGVTYTIAVNKIQLDNIKFLISQFVYQDEVLASNDIIDPTYPIKDGGIVHHVPFHTCSWLFLYNSDDNKTFTKSKLVEYINKLEFYP